MDRNPSPPPEVLQDPKIRGDAIGNTTYSERWLLKVLMRLTKELPDYAKGETAIELQDDLDQELCLVWDTTVEKDVVLKLRDYGILDILQKVITVSKAPRLTEICVGILGNLCFVPEISVELLKNNDRVNLLMEQLSSPDAPTISETIRLIVTSIWSWEKEVKEEPPPWITKLKNTDVITTLQFILSSSKNLNLLQRCMQLVSCLCKYWIDDHLEFLENEVCNTEFIRSACEAVSETWESKDREIREDLQKNVITFFYVISTCDNATDALASHHKVLIRLSQKIFGICSEYPKAKEVRYVNYLIMTLAVLTPLAQDSMASECLPSALHIACEVDKLKGKDSKEQKEEEEETNWEEVKILLTEYLVEVTKTLMENSEHNKLVDCLESVDKLLTYVNWVKEGDSDVIELLKEKLPKSSALHRAIEKLKCEKD